MKTTLRPKTIKAASIAKAIERGRKVSDAWKKHDQRWDEWQAENFELMLIPGMWQRMLQKMESDGYPSSIYAEPPRRYTATEFSCAGLPGYLFKHWNSEPRETWPGSHAPGNCWNGVQRNCYHSLAELLRHWHYAREQGDAKWLDYNERELWSRWRIRIESQSCNTVHQNDTQPETTEPAAAESLFATTS